MRILVCNSQVPFEYGGAEIQAATLVEKLRQRGHKADLVQIPQQWEPRTEVIKGYYVWRLIDLTRTSTQEPVDRVICLKHPSYAVRHPHKVTWLIHQLRQAYDLYGTDYGFMDNTEQDREIRRQIVRMDTKTIGESEQILAISNNVASRLQRFNGLKAGILHPPTALDGRLRFAEYGDYVLSVSRLVPIKRVDLLIRAMALVETPVRCLISGVGIGEKQLQQLAHRLHVEDRCVFLGFIDEERLIDLYAGCLAVYYAPVDEDYGLATVEAMKSHKPVLTAADSGGTLEFVVDGETGFVFDAQEPDVLAKRIDELYRQRDLARRLGDQGYSSVKDITWDQAIDHLLEGSS